MRDLHPFGRAGRARGVDDVGEVSRAGSSIEIRRVLLVARLRSESRQMMRASPPGSWSRNRSSVSRTETCASSSMKASRSAG